MNDIKPNKNSSLHLNGWAVAPVELRDKLIRHQFNHKIPKFIYQAL